jgi:hypothetical protein
VGWTGHWLVPSFGDMVTWYPWLAAGICVVGVSVERCRAARTPLSLGWLVAGASAATVALCCSGALWYLAGLSDAPPCDEGLLPMPAGLTVSAGDRCAAPAAAPGPSSSAEIRRTRGSAHTWPSVATGCERTSNGRRSSRQQPYRASGTGSVTIVWSVDRLFLSRAARSFANPLGQ